MPPESLRVLGRLLNVGYLVEGIDDDRYRPGPTVIDAVTRAAGHQPPATTGPPPTPPSSQRNGGQPTGTAGRATPGPDATVASARSPRR